MKMDFEWPTGGAKAFNTATRKEVVRQYLAGGESLATAAKRLGIANMTMRLWVKKWSSTVKANGTKTPVTTTAKTITVTPYVSMLLREGIRSMDEQTRNINATIEHEITA